MLGGRAWRNLLCLRFLKSKNFEFGYIKRDYEAMESFLKEVSLETKVSEMLGLGANNKKALKVPS